MVAERPPRRPDPRFADADVVVSGRVTSVADAATRAPRGKAPRPITEHAPLWRDAVIEVTAVHKGQRVPRSVRVRFPASTDVAWAGAPKLEAGQRGTFLLKRAGAGYTVVDTLTP